MKKLLIPIGLIVIIVAGVYKFGFSERMFSQRFPDGWTWELNSVGLTSYADGETGQFPEGTTLADDPINLSARRVTADAEGAPAGQVQINDHYETRDPISNEIAWEFTSNATVDATTGQYVDGEFRGDYYFLPRNVDKNATYKVTNSSYVSLPMTFQREEAVAGINTYVFGHYEHINNTVANAPYLDLKPGQEVWCFDFSLEYWVEPVTGEIVKFREWCEGDWVVDAGSSERLYAVSRWGAETTGDDLLVSADKVRSQLNSYKLMTLYLPLLLLAVGVIILGIALVPNFVKNRRTSEKALAS